MKLNNLFGGSKPSSASHRRRGRKTNKASRLLGRLMFNPTFLVVMLMLGSGLGAFWYISANRVIQAEGPGFEPLKAARRLGSRNARNSNPAARQPTPGATPAGLNDLRVDNLVQSSQPTPGVDSPTQSNDPFRQYRESYNLPGSEAARAGGRAPTAPVAGSSGRIPTGPLPGGPLPTGPLQLRPAQPGLSSTSPTRTNPSQMGSAPTSGLGSTAPLGSAAPPTGASTEPSRAGSSSGLPPQLSGPGSYRPLTYRPGFANPASSYPSSPPPATAPNVSASPQFTLWAQPQPVSTPSPASTSRRRP